MILQVAETTWQELRKVVREKSRKQHAPRVLSPSSSSALPPAVTRSSAAGQARTTAGSTCHLGQLARPIQLNAPATAQDGYTQPL